MVGKIWTKKQAEDLWQEDQVLYAEIAAHHPCCRIPTDSMCFFCEEAVNGEWECPELKKLGHYDKTTRSTHQPNPKT